MQANWRRFADKWGYAEKVLTGSYDPSTAIVGGFDRARHYVPFREAKTYRLVLAASVASEGDWNRVGAVVRKYLRVFSATDGTLLALAANGTLPAQAIGERIARVVEKLGLDESAVADIDICDETNLRRWRDALPVGRLLIAGEEALDFDMRLQRLHDLSPSGLRRALDESSTAAV
jgi:hypothetical protein